MSVETLSAAIAASPTVRETRDLLALAVADGDVPTDVLARATAEAARLLHNEHPDLTETVDEIARYIAGTAGLAGIAIANDRGEPLN